jgi:hypothetical protein
MLNPKTRWAIGSLLLVATWSLGGCVNYSPTPAVPASTTTTESTTTTPAPMPMVAPPAAATTTTTTQTAPQ